MCLPIDSCMHEVIRDFNSRGCLFQVHSRRLICTFIGRLCFDRHFMWLWTRICVCVCRTNQITNCRLFGAYHKPSERNDKCLLDTLWYGWVYYEPFPCFCGQRKIDNLSPISLECWNLMFYMHILLFSRQLSQPLPTAFAWKWTQLSAKSKRMVLRQ